MSVPIFIYGDITKALSDARAGDYDIREIRLNPADLQRITRLVERVVAVTNSMQFSSVAMVELKPDATIEPGKTLLKCFKRVPLVEFEEMAEAFENLVEVELLVEPRAEDLPN